MRKGTGLLSRAVMLAAMMGSAFTGAAIANSVIQDKNIQVIHQIKPASETKQFNFRRSGILSHRKFKMVKKLRYGGFEKHFNKKRHGKNLRRKHRRQL